MNETRSTTILAISHNNEVVFVGDGQVTVNNSIFKHKAIKLRKLQNNTVLTGFAGSAADALTLFERFEAKLKEHNGVLARSAFELAKDWRMDKYLRRLEAMMIVGDINSLFLISGTGDLIQPDDGIMAIGSGGNYALAAARALARSCKDMSATDIALSAMTIASELCPFTNSNFTVEKLSR